MAVLWLPIPKDADKKRNTRGVQVASAAGDGLVKIWDAQSGECAATLDNHIDRVWALAVKPPVPALQRRRIQDTDAMEDDEESEAESQLELVSGSADSTLTFWKDTTLLTSEQSASRATARVEQDQELQNHIHAQNYREAIVLALQLNHPKRLLDLFTRVLDSQEKDEEALRARQAWMKSWVAWPTNSSGDLCCDCETGMPMHALQEWRRESCLLFSDFIPKRSSCNFANGGEKGGAAAGGGHAAC
ncbi:U3 small nucleolar RNA-associated protein 13 [Taxawa tesnikishii (nom. ined.)]|nr:U3 small nucleolar RNA-associated protein 13 [Dothideales sp. JES 119]